MDQKLQELTEKLFHEGVTKGNEEAEKIVENARLKAKAILAEANAKAKTMLADAKKKGIELDKNTKSELQLASQQMISALEQEVVSLVNGAIVEASLKEAIDDKAFIQRVIHSAVSNWAPHQDLLVVVSPDDQKEIESFFAANAKKLLDGGLIIESANNIKAGFQIGPSDGSYKVSFTQNDFIEFFKAFIRPRVVELLFDRK
jgi:V/A-type H+-transporting ATPase subunit E